MTDVHLGSMVPGGADPEEVRKLEALITDWWLDHAHQEVSSVAPKAVEYGSNSMVTVGRAVAQVQGRGRVTDDEAIEIACMIYIVGKVGRWLDAVEAGKRPSHDTIYDIGVYAKMAQRNRDVGGWPFAPDNKEQPA